METILLFLVESTICIGVFFLLYKWLLQNLTFFEWRRYCLLLMVIISITLPIFSFEIDQISSNDIFLYSNQVIEGHFEIIGEPISNVQPIDMFNWQIFFSGILAIFCLLYMLIVIWKIAMLINNIARAFSAPGDSVESHYEGIRLILSAQIKKPYSFWKTIYYPADSTLSASEKEIILEHEKIHVIQRHSLDLILLEIVKIVFWFNPIYKYLRDEIELLHEFIADAFVYRHRDHQIHYTQILIKLASVKTHSLVNNFSKIQIKDRIIMLHQNKSNQIQKIKFLCMLPVLGILFLSFSITPSYKSNTISDQMNMASFKAIVPDLFSADKTPDGWPIGDKFRSITSGFGYRKDPIDNTKKFHRGIDIKAPSGTSIVAAGDGSVIFAKSHEGGYGKHIKLQHGEYTTLYSHLSKYIVTENEVVKKGQVIGYVGSTGKSLAAHLHYEVCKNKKPIDPYELLK